jgi:hypothetical protein
MACLVAIQRQSARGQAHSKSFATLTPSRVRQRLARTQRSALRFLKNGSQMWLQILAQRSSLAANVKQSV